ncbi:MAG: VOC family protein [Myxococcales bacterium]|nr:VOC family protein [Myxococcales bacterium]
MFFGLSHVDVLVSDLARALPIYRDGLGFAVKAEGEGWVDLDAATAVIRLVETSDKSQVAKLRIEAPDVPAGVARLLEAGARLVYEPNRTEQLTIEGAVLDADGNRLTIWRNLSEDEYGFDPELPKELVWEPEAEQLLKSLLRAVPALFRALARRKVVKEAEARVGPSGRIDRDLAIRSYISAQAPPNRVRLYEPLREHGIDPEDYRDEFES